MTTIAFDSSTAVCSAALLRDGAVVAERFNLSASNHAALLPTYVQELQAYAADLQLHIEGVVLSEGAGSYTGLRISASLAKGLCYGADLPLIAVPTPAVIAAAAINALMPEISDQPSALICPMIDARRMEVYCALYDTDLHTIQQQAPVIINEQSFARLLEEHVIYFCGDGSDKCKAVIRHPNARWIEQIVPTGAQAGKLAETYINRTDLVRRIEGKQIAYFEPKYLKEFIAAPSHVKGLH